MTRISAMPDELGWKQAYMAAVLEKDKGRTLVLIEHAQQELIGRLHQLKAQELGSRDEIEAIHDASYMLDALRRSLSYRDDLCEPSAKGARPSIRSYAER